MLGDPRTQLPQSFQGEEIGEIGIELRKAQALFPGEQILKVITKSL